MKKTNIACLFAAVLIALPGAARAQNAATPVIKPAAASPKLSTASASPALAAAPDVLVTVNGKTIKRADLDASLWSRYATQTLNQMVDQVLVDQDFNAWKSGISKTEKREIGKNVKDRLDKIKGQFKDREALDASLKKAGATWAQLERQIEDQAQRQQMAVDRMGISVSPKEVEDFFKANKDKLASPAAVHLLYFVSANRSRAEDMKAAVAAGADFAKMTQQFAGGAGKDGGGDLGFVTKGMMAPDIEKIAFSLKMGAISDVIQTNLGYYVLEVTEARQAKPAVLKDIKDDLTQALLAQKIKAATPDYMKSLYQKAKIATNSSLVTKKP